VLREATAMLRTEQAALSEGAAAGAALDCAFARARFHSEEATVFPAEGPFHLSGLRHPMIPRGEVVANDFLMPPDWRVLVVSGPNAGGKSVLLKAVGLAVASAQSGLGAAAGAGSTIPHFRSIRVSIGDQQSLVEKLSTYSARLAEELEMLTGAGSDTLVLLDEPAAGTDPLPGAALAAAILEALAASGARAVVTTHLGPLKTLASIHPGFYNGSMNFSEEHIIPDYRFRFGIPGSSFALEIAGRMGFPGKVLARAQELAGDSFKLDRLIADLAAQVGAVAAERAALAEATAEAGRSKAHLDAELAGQKAESARARVEQDSRMAAVIREASSRADSLLARIRDGGPEERREARRGMRTLAAELAPVRGGGTAAAVPDRGEHLAPGDGVTVPGWNGTGVIESVRSGTAVVRIGSMSVEKPVAELARAEVEGRLERAAQWDMAPPSPEVDVRGMSSEEAVNELDLRIDACAAAGVSRLRIIHGKGRGILMKAVTDYLRRDRRVASSSMAEPREGGTGVTIAILRSGGA